MNKRQRAFCDAYIISGNATAAAREAGYAAGSARQTAARLLTSNNIRTYIASRVEVAEIGRVADMNEGLTFLSDTMRGKIKDQFGLDASLTDRLAAARELVKRFSIGDRQTDALSRVDAMLTEFRRAIGTDNEQ